MLKQRNEKGFWSASTPPPEWVESLRRDRVPRGEIVQRAVAGTTFSDSIPGLPQGGSYAVVTFRSSFANQTEGVEAVTLEVGADYGWHVIGYAIQTWRMPGSTRSAATSAACTFAPRGPRLPARVLLIRIAGRRLMATTLSQAPTCTLPWQQIRWMH